VRNPKKAHIFLEIRKNMSLFSAFAYISHAENGITSIFFQLYPLNPEKTAPKQTDFASTAPQKQK